MVIWLDGDLGAGKTTLVRGLLRAVGETGPVKSPTYTLVEVHPISELYFYHFDFYRFNQAEEYLDAGLDEYFSGKGICLVEWPENARPYLPEADLQLELRIVTTCPGQAPSREALIEANTPKGNQCLKALAVATVSGLPPPA